MTDVLEFAGVVLAIAAPFLIAIVLRHYFEDRSAVAKQLNETHLEFAELDHAALIQTVGKLQERIEVLEAMVADERYVLNRSIANL
jgi:hypothetical protein